jgi:phage gp29-like protein
VPVNLYSLIDNILNCVFYGFQTFVLNWEYSDGLYIPRIEDRPQQYFFYDTSNHLRIRNTGGPADGSLADALAFSVARNKPTYSNPYGEKLASKIFWSVTFKKGGMKFWLKMSEKYGMPFLFGKTPKATTQEKRQDFLDMLSNMIQDGVAVINKEDAVELMESSGKGDSGNLYQSLISHCNNEITKVFLTVSNTTEQQSVGSYAAARVQQDGEKAVNQADAYIVERFMNELITRITQINFSESAVPKFIMFEKQDVDSELAKRDEILARIGVKFTPEYFKTKYNLTESEFTL